MLLTPHTVAAIAIASLVKQPELALPLAFISHFALDLIPHWDPLAGKLQEREFDRLRGKILLFVFADFLIAFDLGLFFVWRALPDTVLATVIFLAAFLANLPDGLMTPRAFLGKKWNWLMSYTRFHARFQTKLSLPWGLLPQAVVAAIGLLIVLRQTLP